ncbi:sigma-70 family RNA polymerase sigma factor [Amycolatopsis solani]|uniref:sigma-70 family RNA polymerase sigma factor n=1 Tax=Amycolatopsis solani TaxID=3028615 RepID=UPI0025B14EA8|nr:sigma-70 family RNA polymerase sigma factor [Amycolatopsis sp. MEP2-6]
MDDRPDRASAVPAGDERAFGRLLERHRHELRVHCHRLLGSYDEAEDMVQETFLRAWRKRAQYAGRSTFRAWLYRIATNCCLDHLARQPETDELDGGPEPSTPGADAAVLAREVLELAFLTALQHLPPKQRAVLVLRDVLGWSAKECADVLEISVASANSALQRARSTMKRHLPGARSERTRPPGAERVLLRRYMSALDRSEVDVVAELLDQDRPAA